MTPVNLNDQMSFFNKNKSSNFAAMSMLAKAQTPNVANMQMEVIPENPIDTSLNELSRLDTINSSIGPISPAQTSLFIQTNFLPARSSKSPKIYQKNPKKFIFFNFWVFHERVFHEFFVLN